MAWQCAHASLLVEAWLETNPMCGLGMLVLAAGIAWAIGSFIVVRRNQYPPGLGGYHSHRRTLAGAIWVGLIPSLVVGIWFTSMCAE